VQNKKIVIAGGGPAGLMAAIRASQLSKQVTLIEKNHSPGEKLLLSGKGRCNLTNNCDLDSFIKRFSGNNGLFLRDAFKKFFNLDLIEFFEKRGLKLKTERQMRVFPVTDRSDSIVGVLYRELQKNKVQLISKSVVKDVKGEDTELSYVAPPWIELRAWKGRGTVYLPLRGREQHEFWAGQPVVVQMRVGVLGIPWVVRIERDAERQAKQILEFVPASAWAWKNIFPGSSTSPSPASSPSPTPNPTTRFSRSWGWRAAVA